MVTAAIGITFLMDVDSVVVAICIAIIVTIACILPLIIEGLFASRASVDLTDLTFVIVVFFPARLATCNLTIIRDFGSFDDLVLRLLSFQYDLLAGWLLNDDGLWDFLTDNDRLNWFGAREVFS